MSSHLWNLPYLLWDCTEGRKALRAEALNFRGEDDSTKSPLPLKAKGMLNYFIPSITEKNTPQAPGYLC